MGETFRPYLSPLETTVRSYAGSGHDSSTVPPLIPQEQRTNLTRVKAPVWLISPILGAGPELHQSYSGSAVAEPENPAQAAARGATYSCITGHIHAATRCAASSPPTGSGRARSRRGLRPQKQNLSWSLDSPSS